MKLGSAHANFFGRNSATTSVARQISSRQRPRLATFSDVDSRQDHRTAANENKPIVTGRFLPRCHPSKYHDLP
jgi:hypothetical protein